MFRSGLQWQRRSDERVVQSLRFGQVGHSPKECVTLGWVGTANCFMDTASLIQLTFWLWTWTCLILIFHSFQSKFQPSTVCTYDRSRYLTIDEFGRMLFKLDGDAHGNLGWKLFSVFVPSLLLFRSVQTISQLLPEKKSTLFGTYISYKIITSFFEDSDSNAKKTRKGLEYNCQNERSFGFESWWIWNAESYGQSISHHGPCDLKAIGLAKQMVWGGSSCWFGSIS